MGFQQHPSPQDLAALARAGSPEGAVRDHLLSGCRRCLDIFGHAVDEQRLPGLARRIWAETPGPEEWAEARDPVNSQVLAFQPRPHGPR